MERTFKHLRQIRANILGFTGKFSLDQINAIPEGFRNNLIWNMGHCVATQQRLVYSLSGTVPIMPEDYIKKYMKGTKPEGPVTAQERAVIESFLQSTPDDLEKAYLQGYFQSFKPYTTSFGLTLNSVEDAIIFNNLHESMHLGNMISMSNLI